MRSIVTVCLLLSLAVPATGDEGMWTFDHVPRAAFHQKYGVDLTQAWLDHVRLSTVRVGRGCTGSFISPDGLVLTNHHCAQRALADNSSSGRDLLADGFLARTREEELPCRAYQVLVLVGMEDVTDRLRSAVAGLDEKRANESRKRAMTQIEKAAEDASKRDPRTGPLLCEVVTLYDGGQYSLYKYKRYDDVRLVFTPEMAIAEFGGDPDNFQFPRWDLDMAILRVYEHGKPAHVDHYLRIDFAGPREGEPVFVSGHPGTTERLLTVAELKTVRDVTTPATLLRTSELRGRLIQFGKSGAEPNRIVQDPLLSLENSIKVRRKEMDALLDDSLLASKMRDEERLRARVTADPRLRSAAGSAWDAIARAQLAARRLSPRRAFLEGSEGFRSELYAYARTLVRAAAERAKPNEHRLREYTEAALPGMTQRLFAPRPVYPALETLTLSFSLERMREWLGPDDAFVKKVLGADAPDSLATRLVAGTALADPAVRKRLWEGGAAAIAACKDPMIVFVRRLDPDARAIRQRYEDEVEAPTTLGSERIALARFAVYGTELYPDATSTLRLNGGTVRGWLEHDASVRPMTTLDGLYPRVTGQDPFELPRSWIEARPRLDPRTPFNLCTDNDIVGGNSGSPLINARGELVGLMFDGNIHSISGTYWFDAARNRAVAVHPAIIKQALEKVYGAKSLLREIEGTN
jgi:hypothetical protein